MTQPVLGLRHHPQLAALMVHLSDPAPVGSCPPHTHPDSPHLDLLDIRVPLPHCFHAFHELFIKPLHGLVHHHLQAEYLAHIWDHFTQHFVPIRLSGRKKELRDKGWRKLSLGLEHIDGQGRQGRKGSGTENS